MASNVGRSLRLGYSPIENVLIGYGLKSQAEMHRKNGLLQAQFAEKAP